MCQNTESAFNQIMAAMDEQGDVDFVKDLNQDELRSFNELVYMAEQFLARAERALDRVVDDRVDEVFEGDR
jgi:hypothetical protein